MTIADRVNAIANRLSTMTNTKYEAKEKDYGDMAEFLRQMETSEWLVTNGDHSFTFITAPFGDMIVGPVCNTSVEQKAYNDDQTMDNLLTTFLKFEQCRK
jgi:hypothetical protein